ncbi:MAG: DUF4267 domain-containing protein [Candidatus Binatia bacterium]
MGKNDASRGPRAPLTDGASTPSGVMLTREFLQRGLVVLFGMALVAIGLASFVSPVAAAVAFGVPEAASSMPFVRAAGSRDLAIGCFALLLVGLGADHRILGGFVLVTALIPIGDVAIVYASSGTSTLPALLLHAVSIPFLVALGASLLRQNPGQVQVSESRG